MAHQIDVFSVKECVNKGNGKRFWMVTVNGGLLGDSKVFDNQAGADKSAREYVARDPEYRVYTPA